MINDAINIAVLLDAGADRPLVEATLQATNDKVNVACVVEGLEGAPAVIQDSAADMLVLACSGDPEGATGVVRTWRAAHPGRPVVALCEAALDYFVHALFESGVDDVVKLPESPERVVFTFEKALARHHGRAADGRGELAPVICVLGPKGGTGKTVTSTNLAVALARAGRRTALVDLDLQFGDLGLALGLDPSRTVYDLATSGGALDAEKLEAYLAPHESGVKTLLAPVRPDQASGVSTELMRSVYTVLATTYDVVVVDTPPDFTPHVIAAVDMSSHVCMVGMLDSLSLKNTKLGLETLELMGYERSAISLVLNRANSSVGLTRDDVEAILGREPDVFVPSDRAVPRSINEGSPIVLSRGRSPVAAAYRTLAGMYLDGEATAVLVAEVNGNGHASTNGHASANGNGAGDGAGLRRRLLGRRKG